MKPATWAAIALLLFTLTGCAALGPKPDPVSAAEHRNLAETLIRAKDYPAAANELTLALRQTPESAELRLRLGELIEALGNNRGARKNYQEGLKFIEANAPLHGEMTYRLALLYLNKLGERKRAAALLPTLKEGGAERADLQAVMALHDDDPRKALAILNEALQAPPHQPMIPRILFHAAQAYHLLGDEDQTRGTLYQAINHSENLSLTRDIEVFWNRLNREGSPPR